MARYWILTLLLLVSDCRAAFAAAEPSEPASIPTFQFLGIGGYLVRWRGEALLIAPLFSHPSPFSLSMKPDEIKLSQKMPPADDVTMLLIGHAHYDHLLDVPWIMQHRAPNAIAYGSVTVGRILRAVIAPERVVDAQSKMARVQNGKPAEKGTWIYSTQRHFRAMPIQSMHAPHFAGYTLASGSYDKDADLTELPSTALGWKQGQVLAWMIDLLNDAGEPVLRLHYLDSASSPPFGLPVLQGDGKPVDVQILAVSSWQNVDDYPSALLASTKPRLVVLGHWENFLVDDAKGAEDLPLQQIGDLIKATCQSAPGAKVIKPQPLDLITLPSLKDATVNADQEGTDSMPNLCGP
ncbi:hypothetical protein [Pseudomonas sp. TWI929]|uniref:hypothetical protein n=1 Tax=Pseudomonas sp. TWI929 TaxID=3136795 RepID=UPI003208391B